MVAEISDFTSRTAQSAWWVAQESEQTRMVCSFQGYNLWVKFRSFCITVLQANTISGTNDIDAESDGIGWKTLSFILSLMNGTTYRLPDGDPLKQAVIRGFFWTNPSMAANRETVGPFTTEDRARITAWMIWVTFYSAGPTNTSDPITARIVQWAAGQNLSRAQLYRLDQIILPSNVVPLPMPGVLQVPVSDAPTNPICDRISPSTSNTLANVDRTTMSTRGSNKVAAAVGVLAVITLGIGGFLVARNLHSNAYVPESLRKKNRRAGNWRRSDPQWRRGPGGYR